MDVEQTLKSFVASHQRTITSLLSDFVAIPTVNPPGLAYRDCVEFLERLLDQWGFEHRVVQVPNGGEYPRFSLIGASAAGDPGLHFHGHYDVVSAQSQEQFKAAQSDGRLYGRGTADMKGGIVAMLFALRAIQQCRIRLSSPVSFTLVPDEETGGSLGMRYLAAQGLLPKPRFGALMPEPSRGVVWNACRGALTLRVRVKGTPTHGAMPQPGLNAFEGMVRVAGDLLPVKQRVTARRTALPMTPPEASHSVMLIGGAAESGADSNMVPASAWFSIERRFNPEEKLAQVRGELEDVVERHRAAGLEIDTETFQESEACLSSPGAELGRALAAAIGDATGTPARFELCPGVLETRFFCNEGVPGYGYGPGLLEVSHGPEEYVDLRALFDCTVAYALTAARLLA